MYTVQCKDNSISKNQGPFARSYNTRLLHRRENTVRLRRMHLAYLAPELLAALPTSNQAAVSTHSLAYTRFTDVFAYGCAAPGTLAPLLRCQR